MGLSIRFHLAGHALDSEDCQLVYRLVSMVYSVKATNGSCQRERVSMESIQTNSTLTDMLGFGHLVHLVCYKINSREFGWDSMRRERVISTFAIGRVQVGRL